MKASGALSCGLLAFLLMLIEIEPGANVGAYSPMNVGRKLAQPHLGDADKDQGTLGLLRVGAPKSGQS